MTKQDKQKKLAKIARLAEQFEIEERRKGNAPPVELQRILHQKTKEFCLALGADQNVATIGAYLMDSRIGLALREGRVKDHVYMGIEAAREFFLKNPIPTDTQLKIENIIASHHKSVPYESLEAEIVANADCFKFLHPAGGLFFLTDLGSRKMPFSEALRYFEEKIEEKYAIISLDICREEACQYYQRWTEIIQIAKAFRE